MDTPATSGKIRIAPKSDRYQVVERLGEGGMAVVYRAADNEQRRFCALKVLLPQFRDNANVRARFRAEAMAMIELRHRNVIEVWDAQVEGDEPFFAMELATGGCIVDWVTENGPMPPRMAVDVAIQVCKGLRAAHDRGLVHRDVKPHNILVNRRGVCKLTDFGIARHDDIDGLTMDGRGMGTLGYIAPEQKDEAGRVDQRADIYSAGATLHTLLRGQTTLDLYLADQEPEMMEGIPPALQAAIVKATRYRAEDRFQNISEFAKALFHAKGSLPEDPPDTPSLVLGESNFTEEEIERFVSSASTLPPEPLFPDNQATSSIPSLTRGDLLRPATDEVPKPTVEEDDDAPAPLVPRSVWLPGAFALGSLPLWALLFIVIVLSSIRGQTLTRSKQSVMLERIELAQALEQEAGMVEDLVAIGADREPLVTALAEARESTGYEQAHATHRLVLLASDEADRYRPHESEATIGTSRSADQRIHRLAEAVADLAHAENYDAEMRYDGIGRIAVLLRMGPGLD